MDSSEKLVNDKKATKEKKQPSKKKTGLTFKAIEQDFREALPKFVENNIEIGPIDSLGNKEVQDLFLFLRDPEFEYDNRQILTKIDLESCILLLSVAVSEKALDFLLGKIVNLRQISELLSNGNLNAAAKIRILESLFLNRRIDYSIKHSLMSIADSQEMIPLLSQKTAISLVQELMQNQDYDHLISLSKKNPYLLEILATFTEKTALKPLTRMIQLDSLKFFELISLTDLNKMDFSLLKKLRESLSNSDIRKLGQSVWYGENPISIDFLNVFVFPKYIESVKSAQLLEDLIDLAIVKNSFPSFKQEEVFLKKITTLLNAESSLSKLLADPNSFERAEVLKKLREAEAQLKAELSGSREEIDQLKRKLESSNESLARLEQQIIDLKIEIQKTENVDSRETIVNEYRKLLPSFDQLISKYSIDALTVFAKVGIQVIGVKGNQMEWDSDVCETLSGNEISIGKVMKEGIILNFNEQRIVLRRVLLGTI
jgi:hypothetical protein